MGGGEGLTPGKGKYSAPVSSMGKATSGFKNKRGGRKMNKTSRLQSDEEKASAPLLRIAWFLSSLLCSAFLFTQFGDVPFYATHRPQMLKTITWVAALVGPLSVVAVLLLNRPKRRWKTVALVLTGISVGSVAAVCHVLFAWRMGSGG